MRTLKDVRTGRSINFPFVKRSSLFLFLEGVPGPQSTLGYARDSVTLPPFGGQRTSFQSPFGLVDHLTVGVPPPGFVDHSRFDRSSPPTGAHTPVS